MKLILFAISFLFLIASCSQKENPEAEAQRCLQQSREALATANYKDAKAAIDSLRKKYPLALQARGEAILLLDSICIAEAQAELQQLETEQSKIAHPDRIAQDTLSLIHDEAVQKVKFFERKLQEDQKRNETFSQQNASQKKKRCLADSNCR